MINPNFKEHTPSFGDLLRIRRHSAGLTQADLAEQAQITKSQVSRLEMGRARPRPYTVGQFLKGLCIPDDDPRTQELREAAGRMWSGEKNFGGGLQQATTAGNREIWREIGLYAISDHLERYYALRNMVYEVIVAATHRQRREGWGYGIFRFSPNEWYQHYINILQELAQKPEEGNYWSVTNMNNASRWEGPLGQKALDLNFELAQSGKLSINRIIILNGLTRFNPDTWDFIADHLRHGIKLAVIDDLQLPFVPRDDLEIFGNMAVGYLGKSGEITLDITDRSVQMAHGGLGQLREHELESDALAEELLSHGHGDAAKMYAESPLEPI